MSRIQNIFNFKGNEVRVVMNNDEPWFVAKDVCDVLEIANPTQALHRLDDDERSMFNIGRQGDVNVVNEPGLYSLILGSRKPEAKSFKRWVTHEVIPSIRKHGAYMTPETIERTITDPDFIIGLATRLKEEQQRTANLQKQIELDKPKVVFADAVTTSKTSILVGELAKILKQNGVCIGQNRLFEWLRENGFLIKRKGTDYNMPTQKSMELGLFEIKETSVTHSDGNITINKTPKVTGKGQLYFVNKFKESA